jgi:hypothetical protein
MKVHLIPLQIRVLADVLSGLADQLGVTKGAELTDEHHQEVLVDIDTEEGMSLRVCICDLHLRFLYPENEFPGRYHEVINNMDALDT